MLRCRAPSPFPEFSEVVPHGQKSIINNSKADLKHSAFWEQLQLGN